MPAAAGLRMPAARMRDSAHRLASRTHALHHSGAPGAIMPTRRSSRFTPGRPAATILPPALLRAFFRCSVIAHLLRWERTVLRFDPARGGCSVVLKEDGRRRAAAPLLPVRGTNRVEAVKPQAAALSRSSEVALCVISDPTISPGVFPRPSAVKFQVLQSRGFPANTRCRPASVPLDSA
jgi:hypothetical protein